MLVQAVMMENVRREAELNQQVEIVVNTRQVAPSRIDVATQHHSGRRLDPDDRHLVTL